MVWCDPCCQCTRELVCFPFGISGMWAGRSVRWPVFLFFFGITSWMLTCCAGIELLSITVECVLDQLLGGHIISIFFPYSLPLPLFPCLSGFPSLTFSFITFRSASLKWLGCRQSGIWIFSPLAWNAEGPDVAGTLSSPFCPASMWSGSDPSSVALIRGSESCWLRRQPIPAVQFQLLHVIRCKAFEKTHLCFKRGFSVQDVAAVNASHQTSARPSVLNDHLLWSFGVCQLLRRWFLDDLWPRWWCKVSCVATRPTSGLLSSTHNVLNSHDLLCSCVKGQVQQIGFWYRTVILPTFHGSAQSTVILINLDCYYSNSLSAYTVNSYCRCTSNACIYNGRDLVLLWLITWLLFHVLK